VVCISSVLVGTDDENYDYLTVVFQHLCAVASVHQWILQFR